MMKYLIAIIITGSMFHAYAADGLKVKPGKWEFNSTTTMPGMGAPRSQVNHECIKDSTVTPDTLMQDMHQGCELLNSDTSSKNMSWKVSCSQNGGTMTGEGNVTSGGDTLKGGMQMNMSFNGQAMNMQVEWQGRHVGSCQ